MQIDPKDTALPKLHQLMLGAVAPRPIAFASTLDNRGNPNLSPFSFFNVFGVNPLTLVFSPSRRGRDNTTKHTYDNVRQLAEVVINVVTRDIVEQANLASNEYAEGVNEFLKAGLTMIPAVKVKPFRVKESPVQFECRVTDIIETGDQGGAGNLVICEVLMLHIDDNILDPEGMIDPDRIRLVGRLGGDHYCEAFGKAVFDVKKPPREPGIGIDQLPPAIRLSTVLTGNDLARLASLRSLPEEDEITKCMEIPEVAGILPGDEEAVSRLHHLAKKMISEGRIREALCVAMISTRGG